MSRRPKPKPYAPRVETLEMRRMMSRSSELLAASAPVKPELDAFAWEILENPGVAAEMHLGRLVNQLSGLGASAVAKQGLGELLLRQLAKEPGYAAEHGLAGLLQHPATAISTLSIEMTASAGVNSIRPDLESFAWSLLDNPGLVKKRELGTLVSQLGNASAMAIADYGLGGILAKDLSREPGYAAKHGLSGLILKPDPVITPSPAPASSPAILPARTSQQTPTVSSGSVLSPVTTPAVSGVHPQITPAPGFSVFTICSGCQMTAREALPTGAAATATPSGPAIGATS